MKTRIQLLFLLVLASGWCQSSYARTAKEYFHHEHSSEAIMEDVFSHEEYDSVMNEVRAYVFGELLPSMDSNSIAYADTLFKYIDYTAYLCEDRELSISLARQARRIILAQEGKTPRYVKSLEYELDFLGAKYFPYPADKVSLAMDILGELNDYYHTYNRPTDEKYISTLQRLYHCEFVRDICPKKDSLRSNFVSNLPYLFAEAAFVWNDLLTWNDITQQEYDSVCFNYAAYSVENDMLLVLYRDHCKDWAYSDRESFAYYSPTNMGAYIDLLHAHIQLLRRTGDNRYFNEVDELIMLLQWKASAYMYEHGGETDPYHWMDTARMYSDELMRVIPAPDEQDMSLFDLHLLIAMCRMSAEGYTPEVKAYLQSLYTVCEKSIRQDEKAMKSTQEKNNASYNYLLAADVLTLLAEGELLNGNGKQAVKLQQQACKQADKFAMKVYETHSREDYAELLMIAIAAKDKKTVDRLKHDGLSYRTSYWKNLQQRCMYMPYRYHLEQLLLQNMRKIYGDDIPREYAQLFNPLDCENIWKTVPYDEDEEDYGEYEEYEIDEDDYSYEDDEDYTPVKVRKVVQIGQLFYSLDEDYLTACVVSPPRTGNLSSSDDEDDEEVYVPSPEYKMKNVVVPDHIFHNGTRYTVTGLSKAFTGCDAVQQIRLPATIGDLSSSTFYNCSNLTKVDVSPKSREYCTVDGVLFSKDKSRLIMFPCGRTGQYTIPGSVRIIEEKAFNMCRLTAIEIPESVNRIGKNAFYQAQLLTSVVWNARQCKLDDAPFGALPDGVTSIRFGSSVEEIPSGLCSWSLKLQSVTIPQNIRRIGKKAFNCRINTVVWNAKRCEDIENSDEVPFTQVVDSFIIGDGVEYVPDFLCYGLSMPVLVLSEGVKSVGFGAFAACDSIVSVAVPGSVDTIARIAFYLCRNLKEINVSSDNPAYCSVDGVLFSKDKHEILAYPAGRSGTYEIQDGVTSIEYAAFGNCDGLQAVEMPGSVTWIEKYAFANCINLTAVSIPENVSMIATEAFDGCQQLTSVVWNARRCADPETFEQTPFSPIIEQITSFEFGKDVEYIPAYLCLNMKNLPAVRLPEGVNTISSWLFAYNYALTSVTIPGNVTEIEGTAFFYCTALSAVTCLAMTPPVMGTLVYDDADAEYGVFATIPEQEQGINCTLYVPAESIEAYRQADQWKNFKNILPIP